MNIDQAIATLNFSDIKRESTEYSLAMYWSGRSSKFSEDLIPVFHWLTMNYVAESLRPGYAGFVRDEVQFPGTGHLLLAQQVCAQLVEHQKNARSGAALPDATAGRGQSLIGVIKSWMRKK